MTLTPDQIKDIKEQLKEQVTNLPQDKKFAALKQIDSLSPQALEAMLKQQQSSNTQGSKDKSIFRMIIDKEIPSVMIDENSVAIAVLDIAPISQGHTIIIPKKPISNAKELPTLAFSLAKKLAKKIESKLKAKNSEIQTESKFNEVIINIIPSYDKKMNLDSARSKSSIEQLEETAKSLKKSVAKIEKIKIKKTTGSEDQLVKLKRRVP